MPPKDSKRDWACPRCNERFFSRYSAQRHIDQSCWKACDECCSSNTQVTCDIQRSQAPASCSNCRNKGTSCTRQSGPIQGLLAVKVPQQAQSSPAASQPAQTAQPALQPTQAAPLAPVTTMTGRGGSKKRKTAPKGTRDTGAKKGRKKQEAEVQKGTDDEQSGVEAPREGQQLPPGLSQRSRPHPYVLPGPLASQASQLHPLSAGATAMNSGGPHATSLQPQSHPFGPPSTSFPNTDPFTSDPYFGQGLGRQGVPRGPSGTFPPTTQIGPGVSPEQDLINLWTAVEPADLRTFNPNPELRRVNATDLARRQAGEGRLGYPPNHPLSTPGIQPPQQGPGQLIRRQQSRQVPMGQNQGQSSAARQGPQQGEQTTDPDLFDWIHNQPSWPDYDYGGDAQNDTATSWSGQNASYIPLGHPFAAPLTSGRVQETRYHTGNGTLSNLREQQQAYHSGDEAIAEDCENVDPNAGTAPLPPHQQRPSHNQPSTLPRGTIEGTPSTMAHTRASRGTVQGNSDGNGSQSGGSPALSALARPSHPPVAAPNDPVITLQVRDFYDPTTFHPLQIRYTQPFGPRLVYFCDLRNKRFRYEWNFVYWFRAPLPGNPVNQNGAILKWEHKPRTFDVPHMPGAKMKDGDIIDIIDRDNPMIKDREERDIQLNDEEERCIQESVLGARTLRMQQHARAQAQADNTNTGLMGENENLRAENSQLRDQVVAMQNRIAHLEGTIHAPTEPAAEAEMAHSDGDDGESSSSDEETSETVGEEEHQAPPDEDDAHAEG